MDAGPLGRGVMTSRQFKRGEFVLEYSGEWISRAKDFKARCGEYDRSENPKSYIFWFKYLNKKQW